MATITSIWQAAKIRVAGIAAKDLQASAAGEDLSLLFQKFGVELTSDRTPNFGGTTFETVVPYKLDASDRLLGFSVRVRGQSVVSRGGTVSVVARIDDSRQELHRTFGEVLTDDLSVEVVELDFVGASPAFRPARRTGKLGIKLMLYAERIDVTQAASIVIDSIDVDALVVVAAAGTAKTRTKA